MEIVKINTRSWHYLLWRFTYSLGKKGDWELSAIRTSLCAYVHRIIWLPLPVALLWAVILVVCGVIVALGLIWKLLTGEGYTTPRRIHWAFTSGEKNSLDDLFFRTDGFPIGRFRLYPYRFILPGLGIWFLAWGFRTYPLGTAVGIGTLVAVLAIAGLITLIARSRDSDLWKLVAGYLRAKKEKICPPVEFVRYFNAAPPDKPGPIKDLRESGFKFGDASEMEPEDRSVI